ncbi:MAG: ATP-binding cassette domain-containing protein, partial [Bacteroidales bacterium]
MIIRLEQLVPLPLLEQDTHASDVWNAGEVEFESGTHRVIEAPSGKGKTSLLSILYGLRKDYRGTLRIDGQDAREFGRRRWSELRKTRFAYIFQGLELFPDLSAEENIQLKNRITDRRSRV